MRILYIEDNPANVFLVQRVARMGNHDVVTYPDGETAIAKFEEIAPDVLLVDIQLAGELDGLDVVRMVRSIGSKIPAVAVTAYAMVGDEERCLSAGCDAYLAKPLPVARLIDIFKKYDRSAASGAAPTPPAQPESKPVTPAASQAAAAKGDGAVSPAESMPNKLVAGQSPNGSRDANAMGKQDGNGNK